MGFVNQLIGNKNVFVKVDVSSVNQMDYDVRIERAIKKQDGDLDETKKYTKARKDVYKRQVYLLCQRYS